MSTTMLISFTISFFLTTWIIGVVDDFLFKKEMKRRDKEFMETMHWFKTVYLKENPPPEELPIDIILRKAHKQNEPT